MHVFLQLNGYDLAASTDEAIESIRALYEGNAFRYDCILDWLNRNSVKG